MAAAAIYVVIVFHQHTRYHYGARRATTPARIRHAALPLFIIHAMPPPVVATPPRHIRCRHAGSRHAATIFVVVLCYHRGGERR